MTVWKSHNVTDRAVFLWALLQCCVSNLKRAPPVANLLLLDLQTKAEGGVIHAPPTHQAQRTERRGVDDTLGANRGKGKVIRDMLKGQKVTRTLSEPKASKVVGMVDEEEKRADTVAPVGTDAVLRGLNMDERAFMAAAKRMGGGTLEQGGEDSCVSDPKARFFQNRLKMGDSSTAKVVAERKWQQEKKLFKLSPKEQQDLAFAMDLFREEGGAKLAAFGSWAEARIQSLEVENIADIVNVEKQVMPAKDGEGRWPYKNLVETMTVAEPWLLKCQTLLAPYAELANDIHRSAQLLETQMKNMNALEQVLSELLETLTFDHSEQSLVDDIKHADASSRLEEFDSEDFQTAVQIIASKVEALDRMSTLSDMSAVKSAQRLLSERQNEASAILLPALKSYLDHLFATPDKDICHEYFERLRTNRLFGRDSEQHHKFLVAVKSIAVFGKTAYAQLVEHYISLSSKWIIDMLRAMMDKMPKPSPDLSSVVARTEMLVEFIFFVCIAEGAQAFQLFFNATESAANGADLCFSRIIRRQVLDRDIVREFLGSEDLGAQIIPHCVHLHAHYAFDFFSERLANCNDEDIELLLAKVERLIRGEADNQPKEALNEQAGVERLAISVSREDTQEEVHTLYSSTQTVSSDDPDLSRQSITSRLCQSLEDKGCVRESMSVFFDICRDISLICHSVTESLVGSTITSFSTPRDIGSVSGRAGFFECVRSSINLCCDLASPRLQSFGTENRTCEPYETTKTLCERLVAATMRSTEIVTHSCSEPVSDIIKLQSYGYISAKLGEPNLPDMFAPLEHLSTRVRKHVMTRWAQREIFSPILNDLKLTDGRGVADAQTSFCKSVEELDVSGIANRIDGIICDALEDAVNTAVAMPVYSDIILWTKDSLEEILRVAKKEKVPLEPRTALLSFSRELISKLRRMARRFHCQQ